MAVERLSRSVEWFEGLGRPWRVTALVVAHLLIFGAAFVGAFAVRFDLQIPSAQQAVMWQQLPLVVAIKAGVFAALKMFQGWWKYVSLYDVISLAYGLAVGSMVVLAAHLVLWSGEAMPRSIYLLDFMLSLVLLAGARGTLRLSREALAAHSSGGRPKNLLIVGAGDLGDLLVREISRAERLRYRPVAFLDDDANKRGLRLHGIPVEGPLSRLASVVEAYEVEAIIIALPAEESHRVRAVVERARGCGVQPRILPAVEPLLDEEISLRQVRQVSITDLLGRDPVDLDVAAVGRFIAGRRVLVTGAGGSIGSELCRQIMRFSPGQLILVDAGETPLFDIHRELSQQGEQRLVPRVADVADGDRMSQIFEGCRPEVVLHAAAYKHVPLMEANPSEAIKNNVGGTQVVADLSAGQAVETFVLISTDKAVNPTSVMGATKRITELYVQRLASGGGGTRFCAVRFGNVLGSNGSVVPIFGEQIRRGGPVTVTHPEMTRYFMTIPEASQLVLQAAAFDDGGGDHLFILDMGQPVRIADLARDMIRLSGMTEAQVPIVYTGVRPGEKLYEELTLDEEQVDRTGHKKIFIGREAAPRAADFDIRLQALLEAARRGDDRQVRELLGLLVPGYQRGPQGGDERGQSAGYGGARAAR